MSYSVNGLSTFALKPVGVFIVLIRRKKSFNWALFSNLYQAIPDSIEDAWYCTHKFYFVLESCKSSLTAILSYCPRRWIRSDFDTFLNMCIGLRQWGISKSYQYSSSWNADKRFCMDIVNGPEIWSVCQILLQHSKCSASLWQLHKVEEDSFHTHH